MAGTVRALVVIALVAWGAGRADAQVFRPRTGKVVLANPVAAKATERAPIVLAQRTARPGAPLAAPMIAAPPVSAPGSALAAAPAPATPAAPAAPIVATRPQPATAPSAGQQAPKKRIKHVRKPKTDDGDDSGGDDVVVVEDDDE